jgi:hypothetical protein
VHSGGKRNRRFGDVIIDLALIKSQEIRFPVSVVKIKFEQIFTSSFRNSIIAP